jgi:N-carbamoylputrescine amidase
MEGIRFWGNSFVTGPQGEMLTHAPHQDETVLYADIDIEQTKAVRDIWPFLRDRRIDAYKEIVERFCD